jgi:hypothetical protein
VVIRSLPEINHVAQRNQSGTMFSRDQGRRATYMGVTDREQGSKLFMGELFMGPLCRFQGHDPKYGCFQQSRVVQ